jgi:hypothetical protein
VNRKSYGQYRTKLNAVWTAMIQRCHNSNNEYYYNYGGRGISVCSEWRTYDNFKKWAYSHGYAVNKGLTIEREDNDGNYCPENCLWVSRIEQLRNRRNNIRLTIFGETKLQKDWANDIRCKTSYTTFRRRIKQGWNAEKALTTLSLHVGKGA